MRTFLRAVTRRTVPAAARSGSDSEGGDQRRGRRPVVREDEEARRSARAGAALSYLSFFLVQEVEDEGRTGTVPDLMVVLVLIKRPRADRSKS